MKKKNAFFFFLRHFDFVYRAFIGGYTTPLLTQLGLCAELILESEQSTHSGGQSPRERKKNWVPWTSAENDDDDESRSSSAHFFAGEEGCCCCGGYRPWDTADPLAFLGLQ